MYLCTSVFSINKIFVCVIFFLKLDWGNIFARTFLRIKNDKQIELYFMCHIYCHLSHGFENILSKKIFITDSNSQEIISLIFTVRQRCMKGLRW